MIARPKISQNEWKTTAIGAFEVGNFALFSCPVSTFIFTEPTTWGTRAWGATGSQLRMFRATGSISSAVRIDESAAAAALSARHWGQGLVATWSASP